jgi:hypothetical protein
MGATLSEPLRYQVKAAKGHGSGSGFLKVILKTANAQLRLHNLTQADRAYANKHLDPFLMETFSYRGPLEEEEEEEEAPQ